MDIRRTFELATYTADWKKEVKPVNSRRESGIAADIPLGALVLTRQLGTHNVMRVESAAVTVGWNRITETKFGRISFSRKAFFADGGQVMTSGPSLLMEGQHRADHTPFL